MVEDFALGLANKAAAWPPTSRLVVGCTTGHKSMASYALMFKI